MPITQSTQHTNLKLIWHPILVDALTLMRSKETNTETFSRLLDRIAPFLAYEALVELPTQTISIITPVASTEAPVLLNTQVAFVSVLGAGQAFLHGMWKGLAPWASAGMISARRDETSLLAEITYDRLPDNLADWKVVVVDPMLATGGSSSDAIRLLKKKTGANNIILITLLAAPNGVARMRQDHPDITVYTLALDEGLNEFGYIVPGLGDAGDRYFGICPDN